MDARRQDRTQVSIDDFMTGLILGLSERGVHEIHFARSYTWRFHYAVAEAFKGFKADCEEAGLDVRFLIFLDEIHGVSSTIDQAVRAAVGRGLLTIDHPDYEIMRPVPGFTYEGAHLPGGPEPYRKAAGVYIDACYDYVGI